MPTPRDDVAAAAAAARTRLRPPSRAVAWATLVGLGAIVALVFDNVPAVALVVGLVALLGLLRVAAGVRAERRAAPSTAGLPTVDPSRPPDRPDPSGALAPAAALPVVAGVGREQVS